MCAILRHLAVSNLSLLGVGLVKYNFEANSKERNANEDDDRGLGRNFKWVKFQEAFSEAKKEKKPVFLILHRASCPTCQTLKTIFSKSIRLMDLSGEFVMVNVENGVETLGKQDKYQPDGKYVPRILFFTPDGELIREAYNRSPNAEQQYRYFHKSPSSIAETMQFVVQNRDKLMMYPSDPVERN